MFVRRRFSIFVYLLLAAAGTASSVAAQPGKGSPAFRQAQIALQKLGYDPGRVDGRWTRVSTEALKQFQTSQGLPTSGRLDRTTSTRLTDAAGRAVGSGSQTAGRPPEPSSLEMSEGRPSASLFDQMPDPPAVKAAQFPAAPGETRTLDTVPIASPAEHEAKPELVELLPPIAAETARSSENLAWFAVPVGAVPLLIGGGLAMRRRRRRALAAVIEKLHGQTAILAEEARSAPETESDRVGPARSTTNGPLDRAYPSNSTAVASDSDSGPLTDTTPAEPAKRRDASIGGLPADMSALLRSPSPPAVLAPARALDMPSDISVLARSPSTGQGAATTTDLPADISILARTNQGPPPTRPAAAPGGRQNEDNSASWPHTDPGPGRYGPPAEDLSPGAALRARRALIEAQRAKVAATAPPLGITITVETRSSYADRLSRQLADVDDLATRMRSKGDRAWVRAGQYVEVAGRDLDGFVYVGRSLPRADGFGDDSCLINPGLGVAKSRADIEGRLLGYWPAYGAIQPTSRLAYLNWLADGRRDPGIGIGYVFLFLYGLERRAMLERAVEEHDEILKELDRLLGIYGGHRAFLRYATTLVGAIEASGTSVAEEPKPVFETDEGRLPLSVRIAIGRRIADGRAIDADWMLSWTMSHPETRVRTAARRGFEQLRKLFATEFDTLYPTGMLVSPPKAKQRSPSYRAASGTFEVEVGGAAEGLPDIWVLSEEIAAGRALLDACTDQLDSYSRLIGRRPEAAATLAAAALLPPQLRPDVTPTIPGDPLRWFSSRVETGQAVTFAEAYDRAFSNENEKPTPAKLRELGDVLCRFGIGLIPDPRFPHRSSRADALKLFDLGGPSETIEPASPGCRAAMLTTALAMLVAKSDGHVSSDERVLLFQIASATEGVSASERARLIADLDRLEEQEFDFASLKSKLSSIPLKERRTVGEVCVAIACGDGVRHANEVQMLERIYRELGLEASELYASLAGGQPSRPVTAAEDPGSADELVAMSLGGSHAPAFSIGPAPDSKTPRDVAVGKAADFRQDVDADRLASIRAETAAIGSVLAGVFDYETAPEPPKATAVAQTELENESGDGRFEGLDPKRRDLLSKLVERASWPRSEFEELARSFGLVPGGVLEELNDWAFEHLGDVLADDGDTIEMHLELFDTPAMMDA